MGRRRSGRRVARGAGIALLLAPGIVDVMQQQGVRVNARRFRVAPGAVVTALSALAGVWLVRRR
ncbi:hypothetical protein [Burkholderia anthina]|uniref:hypothetical protein n=1 Tax=Burkholderia anthina TaxID=179879 RepID=UPI00158C3556